MPDYGEKVEIYMKQYEKQDDIGIYIPESVCQDFIPEFQAKFPKYGCSVILKDGYNIFTVYHVGKKKMEICYERIVRNSVPDVTTVAVYRQPKKRASRKKKTVTPPVAALPEQQNRSVQIENSEKKENLRMDEEMELEQERTYMMKVTLRLIAELIECKAKSVEDAVNIVREYADRLG